MDRKIASQYFTLMELLVVLAILAILTVLVAPSFCSIQRHSKQISCLSNLRNLTILNFYYAADHGGRLVPVSFDLRFKQGSSRWYAEKNPVTGGMSDRSAFLGRYLTRRMADEGEGTSELACPDFSVDARPGLWTERLCGGYGLNLQLGIARDMENSLNGIAQTVLDVDLTCTGYPLTRIRRPLRNVMFADAASLLHPVYGYALSSGKVGFASQIYSTVHGRPTFHFRHFNKTNMSFSDGHCESLRMKSSVSGYAPNRIGFPFENTQESNSIFLAPGGSSFSPK